MVIRIENLTKTFSNITALHNIDLKVGKGELFGLLGPNGSGKTTMIRILTGQLPPTAGKTLVEGVDSYKEPIHVREKVGIIPEQESPPSFLTAQEYLYFVGKIRAVHGISSKVESWLDFLDFRDQKDFLCKDLSRGTRQKLMFAQAFLHEPSTAFIDEPLINLDPITQKKVKDYLQELVKKKRTVFFCTHVLEIAQDICTSVAILHRGELKYHGKVKKNLSSFFLKQVK